MRTIIDIRQNLYVVYEISNDYLQKNMNQYIYKKYEILSFIEKSTYLSILLDTTKCLIDKENIEHMETLLTDGNFVWSADICHYVRAHNLKLPVFFIKNIKNLNYINPIINDKRYDEILNNIYDEKGYINISKMISGKLIDSQD